MQTYLNKPMEQLASELCAGLMRLRKGYVDSAEALLGILDNTREYPYEFVVYRLTGFRGRGLMPAVSLGGKSLRSDLLALMLDVCDSFELKPADYDQPVLDAQGLAAKLKVSTKTIQRWRRLGLPARRLTFDDGKRRLGFLAPSVRMFTHERRMRVLRSMRFSQMSEPQRREIIRRAKRMARFAQCSLADVSRRLASRTGRAVETIRYTIRRHDSDNPSEAVFPYLSAPLNGDSKEVIYRCFLRGVSVPSLAQRYGRTRGSIYRIVNEMRARQLISRPIEYVYNPTFDLPNADEIILHEHAAVGNDSIIDLAAAPANLPPYLRSLYDVPLLDRSAEQDLFRQYNYLKHKADRLRGQIDVNRVRTSQLKAIESLLLGASSVKNRIVRANLRLVVSIAKKHVGSGPQELFELISDGNVSLMRAVEKFDYSRGNRFSTYASWAIMRNFARTVPHERYQLDRFETGQEETLDIAGSLKAYDPNEVNLPELRESIDVVLAQLSPRERTILIGHYGLDDTRPPQTLDQVGKGIGLSKERVRQIEMQALEKLRKILHPRQSDLLS